MELTLIFYHDELANERADRVVSVSQLLVPRSERLVNNIVTMLGRESAAA